MPLTRARLGLVALWTSVAVSAAGGAYFALSGCAGPSWEQIAFQALATASVALTFMTWQPGTQPLVKMAAFLPALFAVYRVTAALLAAVGGGAALHVLWVGPCAH